MSMRHCNNNIMLLNQYSEHLMDAHMYWDLNVSVKYGYEVIEDLIVYKQGLLPPPLQIFPPSLAQCLPRSLTPNCT
jgi:hypothetical protein